MYLLKVAYLGWLFHGSQIQPRVKTVEGELESALREIGIPGGRFLSRTDAGVSALGNVFVVEEKPSKIGLLNHRLEGIAVWGVTEVERVPAVQCRIYRYYLIGDYPEEEVMKLKKFEGEHDFSGFTKERKATFSKIDNIDIRKFDFGYVIDFKAKRFLWNQIRRIVGTIMGRTAPPEPLILLDIIFEEEPAWKIYPRFLEKFGKRWKEKMAEALVCREMGRKAAHHHSGPARAPHPSVEE